MGQLNADTSHPSSVSPADIANVFATLTKFVIIYRHCPPNTKAGKTLDKDLHHIEQAEFKLARPLTTTAGGTVVVGSPLSDTATLSSGASPIGTITFTLYDPNNTMVYTDHVTVSGNGTYTTSAGDHPGGFTPTIVGTYQWAVSYSGDSNNPKATASSETQSAVYGFGGFTSPLPGSTLQKSGPAMPVIFRLISTAGQPISPPVAAAMAAAKHVKATLSGPGIVTVSALCTWNSVYLLFRCNITIPSGLVASTAYHITAQEYVTGTFVTAPAVRTVPTPNPETVYFK